MCHVCKLNPGHLYQKNKNNFKRPFFLVGLHRCNGALPSLLTKQTPNKDLLALEVLSQTLHLAQLPTQVLLVSQQVAQLPPEVVDVSLKEGLNVVSDCFVSLFLQKGPLGLQDFVFLLKEPDLE